MAMAMNPFTQPGLLIELSPVMAQTIRTGLYKHEGVINRIQSADKSEIVQRARRMALDAIPEAEKAIGSRETEELRIAFDQFDRALALLAAEGWDTLALMAELERYEPRIDLSGRYPEWRFYNPATGKHDARHDAGFLRALRPSRVAGSK